MIKKLSILFILLTLFSCGKKNNGGNDDDGNVDTPPVTASDIEISASRDYGPSSWDDFNENADVTADFLVPLEIDVVAGNSGTGWASLYIGNRKFCFQGNASNNNTNNGTKFILKKEKSNTTTECYSNQDNISFNQNVSINRGDQLRLSINGGGCGPHCMYTEGELTLELQD